MKVFRIYVLTALALCCAFSAKSFRLDRIDPPNWWAGMADSSLQLQLHGTDIRDAEVTVDYPGVTLDSVARLDGSPNWLYLYLNVTPSAKPGDVKITLKSGKKKLTRKFPLLARDSRTRAQGFDSSDLLYLLMPDRFADGNPADNAVASMRFPIGADLSNPNARHGGDLNGVMRNIGYLDSLGITAVWFTPVLENDMPGGSYHGYATTDYYAIDPRFGSNDEYSALVDTLHRHGIKTVMDMIFNHCGSEHPWRLDPPASDWFNFQDKFTQTNYRLSTLTDPYASDRDRRVTTDGWFVAEMPDLNQRNPHLMRYLIQNSVWWIERAAIDGIRMDTYIYADREAMNDWIKALQREYPRFKVVGECWLADTGAEAVWQKGSPQARAMGIDSDLPVVMDFGLMLKSRDLKPFRVQTDANNGLNTFYDHLALDFLYPDPMQVLRFLDNHDTERMIQHDLDSLSRWQQAMTLLLTIPGIPQVYYGSEILKTGTRQGGDGNIRTDMPGAFGSGSDGIISTASLTPEQKEALRFFSRLASWRKTSDAVANGSMKHFLPENGLYVYARTSPKEKVIVMLNGRDEPVSTDLARYAEIIPEKGDYVDVITGETFTLDPATSISLSPRCSLVLVKK